MRYKKGFTLIELLAVIVVLAIILVIATISVNKVIKKSRVDANEINKEAIAKASNNCMIQEQETDCDTISELQEKGYLDDFEDPYTGKSENLDDSYAIIIDDGKANVIYYGDGIVNEVETPPDEYFSWCNNNHTCIDGLTDDGKKWLQEHNDVLFFPDNVEQIKNCQTTSNDCNNFSGINISSLIITSSVSVSANFSNSTISVVRIDGGNLSNSVFKNTNIKNFIIGNASKINVGEYTFDGSNIQNFTIENGAFTWYGFQHGKIGTLTIGNGVTNLGSNTFEGTEIDTIILKANDLPGNINEPFRNSNYGSKLIIDANVTKLGKRVFANNDTSYGNYVRFFNISSVEVKGDKTRFSKKDLYNFGLRWDQIPEDIGDLNDEESYNLYLKESDFVEEARYCAPINNAKNFAKNHSWLKVDDSLCQK